LIYTFYQIRWIYENWFAQAYLNRSKAGDTRNLRTGVVIKDRSQFFHYQFQHSMDFPSLFETKLIWGGDYQRTMPETFGTILPDGTGGRNPISYGRDNKDNDGDGEVDEWDELIVTNEYGLYLQTQSKLNQYFDLILSGRLDLHSGQQDTDGVTFLEDPIGGGKVTYFPQTSPKLGLLYKPSDNHTFRLTAAREFNTPSSQGLYLNLKAAQLSIFDVMAKGNKDGYNYIRDANDELLYYGTVINTPNFQKIVAIPEEYVLLLPPVLGRPAVFVNPDDYRYIEPVRSEEVWTYEFGFAGLLNKRIRGTLDIYYSSYSDFVSDLTFVTPVVVDTSLGIDCLVNVGDCIQGVVPLNETIDIDIGDDGMVGTSDDVIPPAHVPDIVFTNINYGDVKLWGLDGSIFVFLNRNLSANISFSYLGKTSFYNFLTRENDPINAPEYKINATLTYMPDMGINWNIGMRYIPDFDWSAGVHYGTIQSYTVFDGALGYNFNPTYGVLLNINNLNNDVHNEIIGGPKLGRHVTLKLTARF
jgi:outer membrane receptor protein involved in Fe transport